ncbi:MAG: hypothetical protein R3249_06795 [Nitriliruptorales bacterium]|nr:hypothetical protein [Nitriliruptorales bacterium]
MSALDRWIPSDADLDRPGPAAVWRGLALGRLGRSSEAWAAWDGVADPALAPWIAAEKGRLLREFGLHDAAEALEAPAFEASDDVVVRAALAIGLTADAVGRNEVALAAERLAVARGLVASAGAMPAAARQRLRLTWVDVEVAQISGQPLPVDGLPVMDEGGEIEWPEGHAAGTDFHRAKGLLFAGVVRSDPRLLHAAIPLAPPILLWAIQLARHDVFGASALEEARRAWQTITPPPGHEAAVAATSVARRLMR